VGREIDRTGDRLLSGNGAAAVGILRNTSIPDLMVLQIRWGAFRRSRCLLACPHFPDVGLDCLCSRFLAWAGTTTV